MQHRKCNPNETKVEFPSPKIAERERKENNKVEFIFIQFRFNIFCFLSDMARNIIEQKNMRVYRNPK